MFFGTAVFVVDLFFYSSIYIMENNAERLIISAHGGHGHSHGGGGKIDWKSERRTWALVFTIMAAMAVFAVIQMELEAYLKEKGILDECGDPVGPH